MVEVVSSCLHANRRKVTEFCLVEYSLILLLSWRIFYHKKGLKGNRNRTETTNAVVGGAHLCNSAFTIPRPRHAINAMRFHPHRNLIFRLPSARLRGTATEGDPERVEEANMLAGWRAKYENEITERMKSRWWRRLARKREVG